MNLLFWILAALGLFMLSVRFEGWQNAMIFTACGGIVFGLAELSEESYDFAEVFAGASICMANMLFIGRVERRRALKRQSE